MWALAILSILILAMDFIVHVAAVLGFNPQDWIKPEWVANTLFFGAFYALLLIAVFIGVVREKRAKARGIILAEPREPFWFYALVRIVMVYVLASLAIWIFYDRIGGGDAIQQSPGVYMLDSGHGRAPTPISFEQYQWIRRTGTRVCSGSFLLFYMGIAYITVCWARGNDTGNEAGPPPRGASRRWVFVIWRSRH